MNQVHAVTFLALSLIAAGCGSTSPSAPTPTAEAAPPEKIVTITYAINVPNRILFQELLTQYPEGRVMAPLTAQLTYDYSGIYHAANVYYGPLAPAAGAYTLAGIVVAPVNVASKDTFTGAEWPDEYGQFGKTRYQWLGRFAYTIANCLTVDRVEACRR